MQNPNKAQRQAAIMRLLSSSTVVSTSALERSTGASPITIRRDLADLAERGLVIRVHGGALKAPRTGSPQPYSLRVGQDLETKRRLAREAAELINDGDSVILDAGTTCDCVADFLVGRQLSVLALSLRAAATLAARPGVNVIIPGGSVETESLSMFSASTLKTIANFRADVAILGACAVSLESGMATPYYEDALVKQEIIHAAKQIILPTTARKLTRASVHRFGSISDIDQLITTNEAPAELLTQLRNSGLAVTVV